MPQEAQKLMRERQQLDDGINGVRGLEAGSSTTMSS